jgi:hypothetical protein
VAVDAVHDNTDVGNRAFLSSIQSCPRAQEIGFNFTSRSVLYCRKWLLHTVIAAGILFRVSDFKDASCLGRARVSAQAYALDERNKLLAWADVMTAAGDFSRETGLRCEVKLVLGLFASVQHPDGNIAGRMRDA